MTDHPNPHLSTEWPTVPAVNGRKPRCGAVLVHGRGQAPDYMADVAARIGMDDLHLIYPAARDSSWYPARFMNPIEDNQPDLDLALDAMAHAVAAAVSACGDPRRVAVIGFSQGACLLAEYLARTASPLGAAALLTGGYVGPGDGRHEAGTLGGMPVLLSSSEVDEWVPPDRVRETARLFEEMGADVTLDIHCTTEHTVNDAEIEAIRQLLEVVRR